MKVEMILPVKYATCCKMCGRLQYASICLRGEATSSELCECQCVSKKRMTDLFSYTAYQRPVTLVTKCIDWPAYDHEVMTRICHQQLINIT